MSARRVFRLEEFPVPLRPIGMGVGQPSVTPLIAAQFSQRGCHGQVSR